MTVGGVGADGPVGALDEAVRNRQTPELRVSYAATPSSSQTDTHGVIQGNNTMNKAEVLVDWLTANDGKQLVVVDSGLKAAAAAIASTAVPLVLRITLNRPSRGNAINQRMAEQLLAIYELVRQLATQQPSRIRWLLLTGAGKYFCSGKRAVHMYSLYYVMK
jgi:hypothetical protein